MFKKIEYVDWLLIESFFQKIAHAVQKLLGLNNFTLAKILILFNATLGLIWSNYPNLDGFYSMFSIYLSSCMLIAVTWLGKYSSCADNNHVWINPWRDDRGMIFVRMFLIGFTSVALVFSFDQFDFWLPVLGKAYACSVLPIVYFAACTPLPPQTDKSFAVFTDGSRV